MVKNQELTRKILTLATAMNGPMLVRSLFLSGQEQRVAQAMSIAVELSPQPPDGPSLPDAIDMAVCGIVSETEDACILAGLDDTQSETLMQMSKRGIEAFAKACGMVILEELREGRVEVDRDETLSRIDQFLPKILQAETRPLGP